MKNLLNISSIEGNYLCRVATGLFSTTLTRRQRAERLRHQHAAFFTFFAPEGTHILHAPLEKHVLDCELQFTLPDAPKVQPISDGGNIYEIIDEFGGADQLRTAVNQLQSPLYAA